MLAHVLERLGLSYDQLTEEERKTAHEWQKAMDAKPITVEGIKEKLKEEIDRVDKLLINYSNGAKKDLYLKAMKRNLEMLLAFITSPEQSKAQLAVHLKERFNITI